jgi:glycyl-tRNA synthetase
VGEFNLMFETNIGPGSSSPGYLRPETAQGIFVEFPRLKEYARNQLPFGATQIGPAYRNEISPRKGLVRLREFTQAELELFIDPETDDPPLDDVAGIELPLYSAAAQTDQDRGVETVPVGQAVEAGTIGSAWIGYYLAISRRFYERIGVDLERFRFRQHLGGERAHYASDCWDAEAEVDGDWIELTGYAYRSDYDLRKHDEYADDDFTVFKPYDEPVEVERATVDPDMSALGPEYGNDATAVAEALDALASRDPAAFEADTVEIVVGDEPVTVPTAVTGFEMTTETIQGEHLLPHVIEPSFGIDRLLYTVITHAYREDELSGEERTYLELPAAIAPTFVGVFPLMARDGLDERASDLASDLREAGFAVAYDEAGSIGRRYRRQDEVGTPYCLTVDYDTLDDGTVTIRDRDTAAQRRIPIDDLVNLLTDLKDGDRRFEDVGVAVADA